MKRRNSIISLLLVIPAAFATIALTSACGGGNSEGPASTPTAQTAPTAAGASGPDRRSTQNRPHRDQPSRPPQRPAYPPLLRWPNRTHPLRGRKIPPSRRKGASRMEATTVIRRRWPRLRLRNRLLQKQWPKNPPQFRMRTRARVLRQWLPSPLPHRLPRTRRRCSNCPTPKERRYPSVHISDGSPWCWSSTGGSGEPSAVSNSWSCKKTTTPSADSEPKFWR